MAEGLLFVSYRRSQTAQVAPLVAALRAEGIGVFFDQDSIDPLEPFPDRIRTAIADSHALLTWWSSDFGESDHCLHEFRLAWQHARKLGSDLHNRLWVLNPEAGVGHIAAGELDAQNFLTAPRDDAARADLTRRMKAKLDALLAPGNLAGERGAQAAPPLHGVPLGNPLFTGRNRELMRIHSLAHPPRIGAAARDVAVQTHGMGGVGKTELALHYARAFTDAYPGGVFWLNLAGFDPERLPEASLDAAADEAWFAALESCLEHADDLRRRLRDAEGRPLPVAAIRSLLAQQLGDQPSLWVLDNVPPVAREDLRERMLGRWRSPGAASRRLVTTRDARLMPGFAPLKLEVLSPEDAQRLLARYLLPASPTERSAIADLAEELGCHPQALALLGTRVAMDGRADAWTRARIEITKEGALPHIEAITEALRPMLGDKARGIVASLALSIAPLSNPAKTMLMLAAVCPPGLPIPREILFAAFPEEQGEPVDALAPLLQHSLLGARAREEAHCVDIHGLIAEATWLLLVPVDANTKTRSSIEQRVSRVTADQLDDTTASLVSRDGTRPAAVLAAALHPLLAGEASIGLAYALSTFHHADANFPAALTLRELVLRQSEQTLGMTHPNTLNAMNNLALTHQTLGDFDKARSLQESVLEARSKALGDEHPITVTAKNNLAITLGAQSKLAEAKSMHESVLEIRRRLLGEEHPDTWSAMNNLANVLDSLGDLSGARSLLEVAFAKQRRVLGIEHYDTLVSLNNLAGILQALGEISEARALHELALESQRSLLGAEHPDTLSSMNNLAGTLVAQGDLAGATTLQEAAISALSRVLGEEHPRTLSSMHNLANTLHDQGAFPDARKLHEAILATRRRRSGNEHPDTLNSMTGLARTLKAQGDLTGARALQESVLTTRRRIQGEAHPATLNAAAHLADSIWRNGEHETAAKQMRAAADGMARALGTNHPHALSANRTANEMQIALNRKRIPLWKYT